MLRVAGSLTLGEVRGYDQVRMLSREGRPTGLGDTFARYGRIFKTLHVLQVITDGGYRRMLTAQLNISAGRHTLGRRIFFGHRGELRQHYREGMEDQVGALGLALNAVVLWNSLYIDAAVKKLTAAGFPVTTEMISRLSPLQFEHINFPRQVRLHPARHHHPALTARAGRRPRPSVRRGAPPRTRTPRRTPVWGQRARSLQDTVVEGEGLALVLDRESSVEGGSADLEELGDLGDGLPAGLPGPRDRQGVGVRLGWPAAVSALGCCCGEAVEGAFVDQVAFHLGGHRRDHEQHLVGDALPVGPVHPGADAGKDVQVDVPGVQLVLQEHQELFHRPGDPVRFVDHQGVAGLEHRLQGAAQFRAITTGAGRLYDHLAAVSRAQRVELQLVILALAADARVPIRTALACPPVPIAPTVP